MPLDKHSGLSVLASVLAFGAHSGVNVCLEKVEAKHSERGAELRVYWKISAMTPTIMGRTHNTAKMAARMTYFGCSPQERGSQRRRWWWGQPKYEETISAAPGLSAPPEIWWRRKRWRSKKKKEEGRFWLKVSVQSEAKEKEEKVTEGERRRRRREEEKEQGAGLRGGGWGAGLYFISV